MPARRFSDSIGGRRGVFATLLYPLRVLFFVIWHGDTTTVRLILMLSSAAYGWALLSHGGQAFQLKSFREIGAVAGPLPWAAAFFVHFFAVWWRLADKARMGWAFAVNAYGLVLWTVVTGMADHALGQFSPNSSMETVVILMAFVALIRTGLNDEVVTP